MVMDVPGSNLIQDMSFPTENKTLQAATTSAPVEADYKTCKPDLTWLEQVNAG